MAACRSRERKGKQRTGKEAQRKTKDEQEREQRSGGHIEGVYEVSRCCAGGGGQVRSGRRSLHIEARAYTHARAHIQNSYLVY